ncbi:hypothetical protein RWH44_01255 [Microbacterium sp. KSW2-29]|uniref:Uncharacterized protein n=1 Tax=Microbacterium phycohabitans TaxID=3075993 RepID=A0ABU3SHY7_9MICO|nr:hypothetical protein [Microbacterium sp. KSW2-29]MDU0344316.1 hypothetical protein [Microbacterium sp. KSW2-29]
MQDDTDIGAMALRLTVRIDARRIEPEVWRAVIHSGDEADAATRVLTAATLHRVHYADPSWAEQLLEAVPDLSSIGSAFTDRELISMIDESSLFTDSLCVISSVDVDDAAIGSLVSHTLVRGIARVFDGDTIAILLAGAFPPSAGGPVVDPADVAERRAHWASIGFVDIPGTAAMLLPVGSRP